MGSFWYWFFFLDSDLESSQEEAVFEFYNLLCIFISHFFSVGCGSGAIMKSSYTNSIHLHIYLEFCYSKGFNLNPCIYIPWFCTLMLVLIFIFVLFTLSYSIRCLKKPGGMHVHKVKPLSKMKNMDPALNCWQFYFFHFSLGLKFKVIV